MIVYCFCLLIKYDISHVVYKKVILDRLNDQMTFLISSLSLTILLVLMTYDFIFNTCSMNQSSKFSIYTLF